MAAGDPLPNELPFDANDGKAKRCPICGKPAGDAAAAPFCSKRCADVDLHRWLGGVYAVPADEGGDPDVEDRDPSA